MFHGQGGYDDQEEMDLSLGTNLIIFASAIWNARATVDATRATEYAVGAVVATESTATVANEAPATISIPTGGHLLSHSNLVVKLFAI